MKTSDSTAFGSILAKSLSPSSPCSCSRHVSPPVNVEKNLDLKAWITFKRLDDDEWYDSVNLFIVPRYKQSELSGDEWRHHVEVQFLRKGNVLKERGFGNIEAALDFIPSMRHYSFSEDDDAEHKKRQSIDFDALCFQPGCAEKATVEYRLKKEYCQVAPHDGGHVPHFDVRRRFCVKHKTRGDCGFEDSDMNYEIVPLSVKGS